MIFVADATTFVSAFMRNEKRHVKSKAFANEVFSGARRIFVPAIFHTEVMCGLARRFKQFKLDLTELDLIDEQIFSSPFISWRVIDREFARKSGQTGRKYGLRGMDSIYATLAIEAKLELLSDDDQFKAANLPIAVKTIADVYP